MGAISSYPSKDYQESEEKPKGVDSEKRIKFVESINEHNLQLINHTDQKTTIIVGINGVLLGLLFQSYPEGLLQGTSDVLRYLFILLVLLLAASAVSELLVIFPKIYRNRRYEDSFSYHEVIVCKKPWEGRRARVDSWFKRRRNRKCYDDTSEHVDSFERFEKKWKGKIESKEILKDGYHNAFMLAEKLNHMVVWVRLSLSLLLVAVLFLAIFLSIQLHNLSLRL